MQCIYLSQNIGIPFEMIDLKQEINRSHIVDLNKVAIMKLESN